MQVHAVILAIIGLFSLGSGICLEMYRNWRMKRFQRNSGASATQVEAWFRPSHDVMSDLFRRGIAFGFGYPLVLLSAAMLVPYFTQGHLDTKPFYDVGALGTVISYSLGFSLLLAIICAALLFLVSAERLAAGNVLLFMARCQYDYAKAERKCRAWGRAGPIWSIAVRVFGLALLGIAWLLGSTLIQNLAPHWHAWFG